MCVCVNVGRLLGTGSPLRMAKSLCHASPSTPLSPGGLHRKPSDSRGGAQWPGMKAARESGHFDARPGQKNLDTAVEKQKEKAQFLSLDRKFSLCGRDSRDLLALERCKRDLLHHFYHHFRL